MNMLQKRGYQTRSVDHIIGLGFIQLRCNVLRVLQSGLSFVHRVALFPKESDHDSTNPSVLSKYQKRLLASEVCKRTYFHIG